MFISYRRDDTSSATGHLVETLAMRFGSEEVFRDILTIEAGDDFRNVLTTAVQSAQVMLAVIGRFWLRVSGWKSRRLTQSAAAPLTLMARPTTVRKFRESR